nr:MAG TPA: hypothetical protein [Caudoviricetes sp.]
MNKIVCVIIQSVLILFIIFSFSNGVVYFIKNINKDENFYLGFLLTILILNLCFIIEQYKLLKNLYKGEK